MRGLEPEFFDALVGGFLRPLLERVQLDRSLCLELRADALNIYYRGGNLLRLGRAKGAYTAAFDIKYAKGAPLVVPDPRIATDLDVAAWLDAMPRLKLAMDLYLGQHPKEEREIQQLIARDNNIGSVSLMIQHISAPPLAA